MIMLPPGGSVPVQANRDTLREEMAKLTAQVEETHQKVEALKRQFGLESD